MSKYPTNDCFINGVNYKCRTCFDPGRRLYSISDNCSSTKTWRDLLYDIPEFETNNEDLLPQTLCCKCSEKLINHHDYLRQMKNANIKYSQLLTETNFKSQKCEPTTSGSGMRKEQYMTEIKFEDESMAPYDIALNSDSCLQEELRNEDLHHHPADEEYDEYKILHNVPERKFNNLTPTSSNNETFSKFSTENINCCSNSWMTSDAICELQELLNKWNFGSLFSIFYDECIDVDALKFMTSKHLGQIAKKWSIKTGVQIKFEKQLASWRNDKYRCPSIKNVTDVKLNENTNDAENTNDTEHHVPPSVVVSTVDIKVDVEQILKASSQGRSVIEYFRKTGKLNEGTRSVIVDLIINHLIYNDIRMTVKLAEKFAQTIVKLFNKESMEYYYLKQVGKKPQGKIYDKYFNTVRKLKQSGVFIKRPYTRKPILENNKRILDIGAPEENIEKRVEALLQDKCTWAETVSHWEATKNYRLHEMSQATCTYDFLNKWLQYKKPLGYKLIDMDFKHLYPNSKEIQASYKTFSTKIDDIFKERIKDSSCKILYQIMQQMKNASLNGRCFGLFYLLHGILVPSTIIYNVKNGKKICTRFSIRDSQRSFIIDGNSLAACEEDLLDKCATKAQSQPFILISGSIVEPKEIVVYFEGTKYRISTALDAIDICFKIYMVFNLEYPKECMLVWSFIQKYFYNISTNTDNASPTINSLIASLQ